MITLSQRYLFSATHKLWSSALSQTENEAEFGECVEDHPHNYVLEISITGSTDPKTGTIMNIVHMDKLVHEQVLRWVDNQNLGNVSFLANEVLTLETLVRIFQERIAAELPQNVILQQLRLYESDTLWAEYVNPASSQTNQSLVAGRYAAR